MVGSEVNVLTGLVSINFYSAMPILKNVKHEKFAQNIALGMGVSDAYRDAGGQAKSPRSVSQAASHLRSNPRVAARIEELLEKRRVINEKSTAQAINKMALTKEYVLTRLMENVERSMQSVPATKDGRVFKYDGSVANRALELLGKELGLFIDRKEVGKPGEFDDLSADALRQIIAERLGMVKPGH